MKKSKDLTEALTALDKALEPFDVPISAMAISAVAGVYAAQRKSALHRAAGLGANLEMMVESFNETIAHNSRKRKP